MDMGMINPGGRKANRLKLLREIYEEYFKNQGEPYLMTVNKKEDVEKYLALQYLINKKLVTNVKPDYDNYSLVVTADGMDLVEN